MSASRSDSVLSPDVRDKCGQATIAAACFAVLLPRDDALPFTRAERVMALAMVDFWFVTYHFAAQHLACLAVPSPQPEDRRSLDPAP